MCVSILPTSRGGSAFLYRDAEGAPASNGLRYHAALDWFAPGGTVVKAPEGGEVVEVRPSLKSSGQVFGGTAKIQTPMGRVYVCRHIVPSVIGGQRVARGADIGRVTNWTDGPDHVHLEVWRSLSGGYRLENMIDPAQLNWIAYAMPPAVQPKPTPPYGGTLRLEIGSRRWASWAECAGPIRWVAAHGIAADQRCAISWRDGTWRGPVRVTNVCRSLMSKYLD